MRRSRSTIFATDWNFMRRHLVAALLLAGPAAFAQTVSMSGSLGDKALLMIDGAPRTVATGATVQGVKLVSVSGNDAVVEIKGKRVTVVMGGAQVSLGGQASAGERQALLDEGIEIMSLPMPAALKGPVQ